MKKISATLVLYFILTSCGGGGSDNGDSDGSTDPGDGNGPVSDTPQLTLANTFGEYLQVLQEYQIEGLDIPSATDLSRFHSYDNSFSDYTNIASELGIPNPLNGDYETYAQPIYSPPNTMWPDPNGMFRMTPLNESTSSFEGIDLINLTTNEGKLKLFVGIKDTEKDSMGNKRVPTLILVEGMVYDNGVLQYKELKVFEGYFYEYDITSGPSFNGVPGSVFAGRYEQYIVESFLPSNFGFFPTIDGIQQSHSQNTGLSLAYDLYMVRVAGGESIITDESNTLADAPHIRVGNGHSVERTTYIYPGGDTIDTDRDYYTFWLSATNEIDPNPDFATLRSSRYSFSATAYDNDALRCECIGAGYYYPATEIRPRLWRYSVSNPWGNSCNFTFTIAGFYASSINSTDVNCYVSSTTPQFVDIKVEEEALALSDGNDSFEEAAIAPLPNNLQQLSSILDYPEDHDYYRLNKYSVPSYSNGYILEVSRIKLAVGSGAAGFGTIANIVTLLDDGYVTSDGPTNLYCDLYDINFNYIGSTGGSVDCKFNLSSMTVYYLRIRGDRDDVGNLKGAYLIHSHLNVP